MIYQAILVIGVMVFMIGVSIQRQTQIKYLKEISRKLDTLEGTSEMKKDE